MTFEIGQSARLSRTITAEDVAAFARLSGDENPLHMDAAFARGTGFQGRVVHGMLVASYVSTLIGMQLPGPGALWVQQSFRWQAPVFIGDTLELTLTVVHHSPGARALSVKVDAVNQDGKIVMDGSGTVKMVDRREGASQ